MHGAGCTHAVCHMCITCVSTCVCCTCVVCHAPRLLLLHALPRYGGFNKAPSCPAAFPKAAPWNICSHIAFVELDGQMTYKQAMAALATRDQAYAGVCCGGGGVGRVWVCVGCVLGVCWVCWCVTVTPPTLNLQVRCVWERFQACGRVRYMIHEVNFCQKEPLGSKDKSSALFLGVRPQVCECELGVTLTDHGAACFSLLLSSAPSLPPKKTCVSCRECVDDY